jgi:hypothetical protein
MMVTIATLLCLDPLQPKPFVIVVRPDKRMRCGDRRPVLLIEAILTRRLDQF